MDTTLCRITARGVLGALVGVGLLSCSSAHKATHDTGDSLAFVDRGTTKFACSFCNTVFYGNTVRRQRC